jgi:hypothetical protein
VAQEVRRKWIRMPCLPSTHPMTPSTALKRSHLYGYTLTAKIQPKRPAT